MGQSNRQSAVPAPLVGESAETARRERVDERGEGTILNEERSKIKDQTIKKIVMCYMGDQSLRVLEIKDQ